ncbi:MAG: hypothetical protein RHS_3676 [Robinsoniella sp. RHS]|nr:MAG: hypothetical protein RHS_3676 [Robinsoniella sp. RHS]
MNGIYPNRFPNYQMVSLISHHRVFTAQPEIEIPCFRLSACDNLQFFTGDIFQIFLELHGCGCQIFGPNDNSCMIRENKIFCTVAVPFGYLRNDLRLIVSGTVVMNSRDTDGIFFGQCFASGQIIFHLQGKFYIFCGQRLMYSQVICHNLFQICSVTGNSKSFFVRNFNKVCIGIIHRNNRCFIRKRLSICFKFHYGYIIPGNNLAISVSSFCIILLN